MKELIEMIEDDLYYVHVRTSNNETKRVECSNLHQAILYLRRK